MAGSKVKGITVEIGGDTTQLSKALEGVNKELKSSQNELGAVNRLLKLDPSNVELLGQKQRILSDAIATTKEKLDALKQAAAKAKEKLDIGEGSQKDYDKLKRSIIETEQKLESLGDQAEEAGEKLKKSGEKGKAFSEVSEKIAGVSDKVIAGIKGIGVAALGAVPFTDDLRESLSKLEQNAQDANVSLSKTQEVFKQFNSVTGDTDSSVEALSDLFQTGFDENQLQEAVDNLAGAVIRFPDTLNIESLADSIQETVATGGATGQYAELLDRLGIGAKNVSDAMENASTEERKWIVLQTLSKEKLDETYESWAKNNQTLIDNRNAQAELSMAVADFADKVTPLVTKVTELAAAFLDWFNNLSDDGQKAIFILGGLILAIKPVGKVVDTMLDAFDGVVKFLPMMNGKMWLTVGALAALVIGFGAVASVWRDMTGLEKVATVLGTLTAAATAAAIAIGVFHASATMGLAVAGIVAGIAAVTAAVMTAQKSAKGASASFTSPSTGFSAGGSYGTPAMPHGGGSYQGQQMSRGGSQNITLQLDGATLGRAVVPYVNGENQRMGVQLAGG